MLKEYKKSHIVINAILIVLFVFLFVNLLFFKNTSFIFLLITLLIPTSILILTYGYEKKKRRFTYELLFYIFSYCIVFLLITYFIGIFTGFSKNIYKLNQSNLLHNIIPYILLILTSEVLRYEIVRKGEKSTLSYVLITAILVIVDITIFATTYNLATGDGQIKYVCSIVLPTMFKNVALMYFAKYAGVYPNILYRLILDLKLFIVPIIPNFGLYFDCIVNTILPVLMMFLVHLNISFYHPNDSEPIANQKKPFYTYTLYFILIFFVLVINILVSSSVKYSIISIGSGSMHPKISKGDVVIYEKIDNYKDIKNGQVLVFKKDGKTIVHRIIEITDINDEERVYYTKGDANEKPDGYPITNEQVVGIVKFKIKFIGIPSVIISEMLK